MSWPTIQAMHLFLLISNRYENMFVEIDWNLIGLCNTIILNIKAAFLLAQITIKMNDDV